MDFMFDANPSMVHFLDSMPHGLAILNHRYELVSGNRRFRELITCIDSNFTDCWLQSVHPDDYNRVSSRYNDTINSKRALRISYRTRDQIAKWCVMTLDSFGNADGQHSDRGNNSRFACTIVDVTPEKEAEFSQKKLARDAQEQREQQERFVDMISHEIRNPLSAVLHCTEDILDVIRDPRWEEASRLRIAESARIISHCVEHQKRIVSDVLTFSKIDASMLLLVPRTVQPRRHFAVPLSLFGPELRRNLIHFEYQVDHSYIDCEINWVMADLERMNQVLINLLSNAIKFTAKSDKERSIRVSIGASIERPSSYPPNVVFFESNETALSLDSTSSVEWGDGPVKYVMLAVKDTGIGISEQTQLRLFERFNQATPKTERVYGGSGLGLNVSRKLCHLHGGEIGVSSREGEGSTFGFFFKVRESCDAGDEVEMGGLVSEFDRLCRDIQTVGQRFVAGIDSTAETWIPDNPSVTRVEELEPGAPYDERTKITDEIRQQVTGEKNENDRAQTGHSEEGIIKGRILVVEDNIINRRVLSRRLNVLGFHITEADNGQDALEAVRREKFDCILMDQEMPVMDGNSATKKIRDFEHELGVHTPILGVTANVRAAQQVQMRDAGIDDIIHKPYSTDDLVAKVHQILATKTNTNSTGTSLIS